MLDGSNLHQFKIDQSWKRNIYSIYFKYKIFAHYKEKMVKMGKLKYAPPKSPVKVILKDCLITLPLNINDFEV
jgi:hypothetical protein